MSHRLIDTIQRLGRPQILVLGDVILDRYIWGDAERVSQEAPVILLREERQEIRLGGAANVANMLCGLQADVHMAGVLGDDRDGRHVRESLKAAGVDCDCLVADSNRPTTVKERYIGLAQHRHPHQMLRVDREMRTPIHQDMEDELLTRIGNCLPDCQAVLVSDYAKGVCTPRVISALIERAGSLGIPVIGDPPSSGDCRPYAGATAITPNRLETRRATDREIETSEDAFAAGRLLCAQLNLKFAFITLDSDGIALVKPDGTAELHATRRREVYDITGAGDMVLATVGVGAAAGIAPDEIAQLANVAGGLEVEQIGVVNVTRDEMIRDVLDNMHGSLDKVCDLETLGRHVEARRKIGQRIVLTNGCFDVLHYGHVHYLQQARREGDCLIVALNSDESVRTLDKGTDRPIFDQTHRSAMLAALEAVDYVLVFEDSTPQAIIERLQPHLLVKGGTYDETEIVGREIVHAYGGQVKALGAVPGLSTTEILSRIRQENVPPVAIPYPGPRQNRKAG